jgi:hypothetical protein
MRKPLQMLVENADFTDPIRHCTFTDDHWQFFESLLAILEVMHHLRCLCIFGVYNLFQKLMLVTKFFEQHNRPLLHEVLPMFDKLDDAFTELIKDTSIHDVVRYLVSCGFSLLDKYYGKTDEGALYRAALREFFLELSQLIAHWVCSQLFIQTSRKITLFVENGHRSGSKRRSRSFGIFGSSIINLQTTHALLRLVLPCRPNQIKRRKRRKLWYG